MTAEELLRMPDEACRHELIKGDLITMTPAGFGHGAVVLKIAGPLWQHVESRKLGLVLAAETGFRLASNPDTVRAQIQSSVIFGLGAAVKSKITVDKGRVQQRNFDSFEVVRMDEAPRIDIVLVQSKEKPGGIGEPATALIGPAVANAVFKLTGKRVRTLPITKEELA